MYILLIIFSFLVVLTIRRVLLKGTLSFFLIYLFLLPIVSIMLIGAGGILNDANAGLEQFILLEKNNQLQEAKNNPEKYHPLFQIELEQFKNSDDFKVYIQERELFADNFVSVFLGIILALLAEIPLFLIRKYFLKSQNPLFIND